MTADEKPPDEDSRANFWTTLETASAGGEWSSVPAEWFEADPTARRMRAGYVELYRRGSAEQITELLEGIWLMLDRAALWVSSLHLDLAANGDNVIDQTCALLVPEIPRRIRTLTCLGRASLDHLPTAMSAARAAFEAGLRLAWINAPQNPQDRAARVLLVHRDQAKWKRKVAADYDLTTTEAGDRWRRAAQAQDDMVSRALTAVGSPELPRHVPAVSAQLAQLDLGRLYSGYRLASQYVHGGLSSAAEAEMIQAEGNPFGAYWPSDWYLAVNMCAWACHFLAQQGAERGFDLGPVRGAVLASELMFLSPEPGWRQDG